MSLPKISVVTVSFNQGQFIKQNIDSVLAQNYPNFEHLIIDGGSTDQTLDIVQSYPHLSCVSEPDRGQSHALNKGFAKATGEIIAWLNTDDWYAPGVFHEVARALSDRRVALGAAEEVDRFGAKRQTVENVGRSFWDIFKYWVPYAWLAQPSVFFRRDLLEEVKLGPHTYVDESLYFVMDIDLWMRMAMRETFDRHIERTCSYYRIYDENKTGKHPLAAQRELGRLFRRYDSILCRPERPISFIVPAMGRDSQLEGTVHSLIQQTLPNLEIVLVDCAGTRESSKELREFSFDMNTQHQVVSARYTQGTAPDLLANLNQGVSQAAGSLIALISPGDEIADDFCFHASNLFLYDWLGVALVLSACPELKSTLLTPGGSFNPNGAFSLPARFPRLVARKCAWLEIGGFRHTHVPALALREFLLRVSDRSWMISAANNLAIREKAEDFSTENAYASQHHDTITAYLLAELARERSESPFSRIKEQTGIGLDLPQNIIEKAQQLLSMRPPDWLDPALNTRQFFPGAHS